MLNVTDVLSVVLSGTLGRSGRKRARRATNFLTGHKGFLSTSALIGAAGVAWGIYDTIKNQNQGTGSLAPTVPGVPRVPQVPTGSVLLGSNSVPPGSAAFDVAFDPVARIIRLAVSAARADGTLSEPERALILERARVAGLESVVERELAQPSPLAEIVRGVTDPAIKKELYVVAFTIIRADETVSGAERIYLAQLAHQLDLDVVAIQALETSIASRIDTQTEN